MASRSRPRSDGYHHAQVTYVLSFVAWAVGILVASAGHGSAEPMSCAFAAVGGCLLGVVLSPDLDQPSITHSEWVVLKIPLVGRWVLGPLFVAVWMPYAMLFKHRSVWTHGPLISTIVRLGYMLLVIALADRLIGTTHWVSTLMASWDTAQERWTWLAGISGLMLSDLGHWARDVGLLG